MAAIVIVWLFQAFHGVTLLAYLIPLAAAALRGGVRRPADVPSSVRLPVLIAIAPCRHAPDSIPGFVRALRGQDYPADLVCVVVAVDRDEAGDPSAGIARAAGAEALERVDPPIKTKGAALNAAFGRLRKQPFDGVIVFDIDARPSPDFLRRTAAHFAAGHLILQAATVATGTDGAAMSRIAEWGQTLSRLHQEGRAALGWPGFLSGGAMAFHRDALERLAWRTSTGDHLSDDGELNLRCCLSGLRVHYAPDLLIRNDVPASARDVRFQRRRWSAGYQELIVPYFRPMLRRWWSGDWRVLDYVGSLLFASTFSLLFALEAIVLVFAGVAAGMAPSWRPLFAMALVLWLAHAGLYALALRRSGIRFRARDLKAAVLFLAMRALAFFEGWGLASRRRGRNPVPARHSGESDADLKAAAGGRR